MQTFFVLLFTSAYHVSSTDDELLYLDQFDGLCSVDLYLNTLITL